MERDVWRTLVSDPLRPATAQSAVDVIRTNPDEALQIYWWLTRSYSTIFDQRQYVEGGIWRELAAQLQHQAQQDPKWWITWINPASEQGCSMLLFEGDTKFWLEEFNRIGWHVPQIVTDIHEFAVIHSIITGKPHVLQQLIDLGKFEHLRRNDLLGQCDAIGYSKKYGVEVSDILAGAQLLGREHIKMILSYALHAGNAPVWSRWKHALREDECEHIFWWWVKNGKSSDVQHIPFVLQTISTLDETMREKLMTDLREHLAERMEYGQWQVSGMGDWCDMKEWMELLAACNWNAWDLLGVVFKNPFRHHPQIRWLLMQDQLVWPHDIRALPMLAHLSTHRHHVDLHQRIDQLKDRLMLMDQLSSHLNDEQEDDEGRSGRGKRM